MYEKISVKCTANKTTEEAGVNGCLKAVPVTFDLLDVWLILSVRAKNTMVPLKGSLALCHSGFSDNVCVCPPFLLALKIL